MQPVIVGIDPGTTSAFAVLSFDFELLKVKSKKNYPLRSLIADIYKEGNPIIVGTDKKDVPALIKDFSQKTGSVIFTPNYDTKKGEKKTLVEEKGFSKKVNNPHETDALASAIYAYNDFKPLINKINKYVKRNNKRDLKDKIFIEVITKEKSIAKAVKDIEKKPKKPKPPKPPVIIEKKELTKEEKEILLLNKLVKKLKKQIKTLKKENKKLKNKKIDIDIETKKIISFKENRILELDKKNKQLKKKLALKKKEISKLQNFLAHSSNKVLVKKLHDLGREEFNEKNKLLKIRKGDILYVENLAVRSNFVLEKLKNNVRVIMKEKGPKTLKNFIIIENIIEKETENYALADKNKLEKEIKKREKSFQAKEMVQDILEEYKKKRVSEYIE